MTFSVVSFTFEEHVVNCFWLVRFALETQWHVAPVYGVQVLVKHNVA